MTRTDSEIGRPVLQELRHDPPSTRPAFGWRCARDSSRPRAPVTNWAMRLAAQDDFSTQRDDAERAVRNLAGVRGITNMIEVRPPVVASHDVRTPIAATLSRHAEREAKHITIEVRDGRVVLSGVVPSSAEREGLLGAAKGAPGVQVVDDHPRLERAA